MKKTYALGLGLSCLLVGVQAWAATPTVTYQVKKGDTLDKVIRQTFSDSPLKVELLRQAYVEQNPHAFVKAKPPVLRAGAVLAVPNHDDLLRQYARPRDGAFPDYNDRRNWVRYP